MTTIQDEIIKIEKVPNDNNLKAKRLKELRKLNQGKIVFVMNEEFVKTK